MLPAYDAYNSGIADMLDLNHGDEGTTLLTEQFIAPPESVSHLMLLPAELREIILGHIIADSWETDTGYHPKYTVQQGPAIFSHSELDNNVSSLYINKAIRTEFQGVLAKHVPVHKNVDFTLHRCTPDQQNTFSSPCLTEALQLDFDGPVNALRMSSEAMFLDLHCLATERCHHCATPEIPHKNETASGNLRNRSADAGQEWSSASIDPQGAGLGEPQPVEGDAGEKGHDDHFDYDSMDGSNSSGSEVDEDEEDVYAAYIAQVEGPFDGVWEDDVIVAETSLSAEIQATEGFRGLCDLLQKCQHTKDLILHFNISAQNTSVASKSPVDGEPHPLHEALIQAVQKMPNLLRFCVKTRQHVAFGMRDEGRSWSDGSALLLRGAAPTCDESAPAPVRSLYRELHVDAAYWEPGVL